MQPWTMVKGAWGLEVYPVKLRTCTLIFTGLALNGFGIGRIHPLGEELAQTFGFFVLLASTTTITKLPNVRLSRRRKSLAESCPTRQAIKRTNLALRRCR